VIMVTLGTIALYAKLFTENAMKKTTANVKEAGVD